MSPNDAKDAYRRAWIAWKSTASATKRRQLEDLMDSLQPQIAKGPGDPVWKEFTASLPGYLEFWSSPREWFRQHAKEQKE